MTTYVRNQVDTAMESFYTKMNEVNVLMNQYQNANSANKEELKQRLMAKWNEAAQVIQSLREMRDKLNDQGNEAAYNHQQNDTLWQNNASMANSDDYMANRQMRLDSARQLATQSIEQWRRQSKVKWIYVVLFLVLLSAAIYMYTYVSSGEVGLQNAPSSNRSSNRNMSEKMKNGVQDNVAFTKTALAPPPSSRSSSSSSSSSFF